MIESILRQAVNPAIWCSFGKDSLLLLRLALAAGFNGPCYYFGDELSDLAQRTIIDNDLTVYSWPATNRYAVPSGQKWVQVDEYLIGDRLVPFISSIVEGDHCNHMQFTQRYARPFHYPHDVTLTGYKCGETNEAVGATFPQELDIGVTRLAHPLYDWTDEQVIEALGFTSPDENAVEYCEECLTFIESSNWDRDAALARFRSRFNFN